MSETPLQTDSDGRGPDGRFRPGNRISKGNSVARKAGQFRAKLFSSVKAADFRAIIQQLVQEAMAGRPWAVKLVLEYLIGQPRDVDLEERLENLEAVLLGRETK